MGASAGSSSSVRTVAASKPNASATGAKSTSVNIEFATACRTPSESGAPRRTRSRQDLALGPDVQVGLLSPQHPLRVGLGADGGRRPDRSRPRASSTSRSPTQRFRSLRPWKPSRRHLPGPRALQRARDDPRLEGTPEGAGAGLPRWRTTHARSPSRRRRTRPAHGAKSMPSPRSSRRPTSSPTLT